ncbi:hypothetical protein Q3G72_012697 [Acer saccharum]|nr:hypothetical protein Q3G72_012697 [Acer saccharum]
MPMPWNAEMVNVEKFYRGMNLSTRQFVDISTGGSLMNKSMDATYDLIEDMSVANNHWGSDRKTPRKAPGVLEMDQVTALQAQVKALTRQVSKMGASSRAGERSNNRKELARKRKTWLKNRLRKHKDAHNFAKFLKIFKKLHINIPFTEALAQMPKYVKFLKELLANKKKLEDFEMVPLNEECSAILQNKLP